MTEMEKKNVINEIVAKVHQYEKAIITCVSDYLVKDGFPQLYVSRIDNGRPVMGVWIRIGTNGDYSENEYYMCRLQDYRLQLEGYAVYTEQTAEWAFNDIKAVLDKELPEYDEIDYPGEPTLNYNEREFFWWKRELESMWGEPVKDEEVIRFIKVWRRRYGLNIDCLPTEDEDLPF